MSGGWAGSNRKAELPPDWPRIRKEVLVRDDYRCVATLPSGARCPKKATDVDHIGSKWVHAKWNLRSLCHKHHQDHTEDQAVEARKPRGRRLPERHPFDSL